MDWDEGGSSPINGGKGSGHAAATAAVNQDPSGLDHGNIPTHTATTKGPVVQDSGSKIIKPLSNASLAANMVKGNPIGVVANLATRFARSAGSIFKKKPIEERAQKPDMMDMRKRPLLGGDDGGNDYGRARQTFNTQSLVTAPTADKGYGHQWGFQAYPGAPGTTYDPTQYAKKGKMIYKYGTGQEVKKRSLPPSKGPDSKGLPSILENSDYFTKLIGE